ncbi:hypothetical protein Caci_8979 [Catenulispora acidiphila DSM 44928]|uniref:Uncharacterized protein n=1 Tax=Catenulispora acidiphila (strain DSM 44928 / JCM 14897 / NBRC 102108 / NRRL B-24433 / ID139908) TaxID=479433 RepID=C7Q5I1_CATAD|nr:hypothetical protein [Catenulispora acidiphila]ACU77792.1 hypothetical protein Caci_8979 [Catenulispora acidiphila DSM 44928]
MMDAVGSEFVQIGEVTAPSGVLVLGMAGWIDYWSVIGEPLSRRAAAAIDSGGGYLRQFECEAVAVATSSDRPLPVSATVATSLFDGAPTIATLQMDLGRPWTTADQTTVLLGDLPVDHCGMLLGDGAGLDSWSGIGSASIDALADVTFWGALAQEAHGEFGGRDLAALGRPGVFGLLDLPVPEARQLADRLAAWEADSRGRGVKVSIDEHTHHHLVRRAGWAHPLQAATIETAGCQVMGIGWSPGDHAMRHGGERAFGQVYPVTLVPAEDGGTLLRWTIPQQ